eukprot:TRINITY_DN6454_c0_g1_i2.p1 TRINITY_DN6454_c0_g1~~TRINITY_DN6454_c0_g1_i2.p1  ORF type:complete len:239 (-),score=21.01 TRINITY_DN6454_c0_g1_i2:239-955(-)
MRPFSNSWNSSSRWHDICVLNASAMMVGQRVCSNSGALKSPTGRRRRHAPLEVRVTLYLLLTSVWMLLIFLPRIERAARVATNLPTELKEPISPFSQEWHLAEADISSVDELSDQLVSEDGNEDDVTLVPEDSQSPTFSASNSMYAHPLRAVKWLSASASASAYYTFRRSPLSARIIEAMNERVTSGKRLVHSVAETTERIRRWWGIQQLFQSDGNVLIPSRFSRGRKIRMAGKGKAV